MDHDSAAENLQVIRTLMERSALYRRALAPVMIYCGLVGISGGGISSMLAIKSARSFILFWCTVAITALVGSFWFVRRQALRDAEPFWSPPTRRVVGALLPPFCVGAVVSAAVAFFQPTIDFYAKEGVDGSAMRILTIIWLWSYGCAIHSAGFFMQRGFKLFGWLFVMVGCGLFVWLLFSSPFTDVAPNILMSMSFGALHLAYGVYLYFTEQKKSAA